MFISSCKNLQCDAKSDSFYLALAPHKFLKKTKKETWAMQTCLEEDINVWGSKCVGQVRGNVNAKENAL